MNGPQLPRHHRRRRQLRLSVCDDCCCGTSRKHPGVDHAGIRDRLSAAAAADGGRSRRVDCLGVCERSNVVVVRTAHAGSFWVGEVLDEPLVLELETWVRNGAPLPVPPQVAAHVFDRLADPPGDDDAPQPPPPVELVSLTTKPT